MDIQEIVLAMKKPFAEKNVRRPCRNGVEVILAE